MRALLIMSNLRKYKSHSPTLNSTHISWINVGRVGRDSAYTLLYWSNESKWNLVAKMKIADRLFARMIQPTSIRRCKVCISHRDVSYDFHDVTILLPTGWTKELHSVIRPERLGYLLYAWHNLHGLFLANQYPSNWHKILRAFFQTYSLNEAF